MGRMGSGKQRDLCTHIHSYLIPIVFILNIICFPNCYCSLFEIHQRARSPSSELGQLSPGIKRRLLFSALYPIPGQGAGPPLPAREKSCWAPGGQAINWNAAVTVEGSCNSH